MNPILIFLLLLAFLISNFPYIHGAAIPGLQYERYHCIGHFDEHCSHFSSMVSTAVGDPRVSRHHRAVHHDHDNHDYESMKTQHSSVLKWKQWLAHEVKVHGQNSRFGLMQKIDNKVVFKSKIMAEKEKIVETPQNLVKDDDIVVRPGAIMYPVNKKIKTDHGFYSWF